MRAAEKLHSWAAAASNSFKRSSNVNKVVMGSTFHICKCKNSNTPPSKNHSSIGSSKLLTNVSLSHPGCHWLIWNGAGGPVSNFSPIRLGTSSIPCSRWQTSPRANFEDPINLNSSPLFQIIEWVELMWRLWNFYVSILDLKIHEASYLRGRLPGN